jgi:hypothetical protein
MVTGYGIQINSQSIGAASAITTSYGLKIEDQTGAGTNYSIKTGTGIIEFGTDSLTVTTAKTPASASAAGTQGMHAWDANFIYVCTATNTWKRVAIATW